MTNDKKSLYCVIMAGGAGTRFWPESRQSKPKQFLDLCDTGKSFLRMTYERFAHIVPTENFLVVTNARYKELVLEHIPEINENQILCEPIGRNTAPCICYAAFYLRNIAPDAMMIVTPADHLILNEAEFHTIVEDTIEFATENTALMTIGLTPSRPETAYGYIQKSDNTPISRVKCFTEKPNLELAQVFLQSGEFFWNSGIFVWKVKDIIDAIAEHLPEHHALFEEIATKIGTEEEEQAIAQVFAQCRSISIDYGVMEKTDRAWMYPAKFNWQDIGTWESLYNFIPYKDERGNAVGVEKALIEECSNMLVISPERKKLVAVRGLEDYIVIDTDDALVICPKDDRKFKEFISGIAMPEFEKYR